MEKAETNLIGYHLVFSDTSKQLVGEIINISIKEIEVLLIGEIKDNEFLAGILKKPSSDCVIRVINKKEVEYLLGSQDYSNKANLLIFERIDI